VTRQCQLARVDAENRKRSLEFEQEKRNKIRLLEGVKKKHREMFSGGGMGKGEGVDENLFSGGNPKGDFTTVSGGAGGDLSGGDAKEIRRDTPHPTNGVGHGIFGDLAMMDTVRVCFQRGVGPRHGTRVHENMAELVELIRNESNMLDYGGEDPIDVEVSPRSRSSNMSSYEYERLCCISNLIKFMDPCAFSILNTLVTRRIVPIRAEFTIFDEHLMLATNIDMIAWDVGNCKGVAVELKTGHNAQVDYDAHDQVSFFNTDHPTLCIKDTALNRACFQLLIPLMIIKKIYNIDMDTALIIRTASGPPALHNTHQTNYRGLSSKSAQNSRITRLVQMYRIPEWMMEKECQKMITDRFEGYVLQVIEDKKKIDESTKELMRSHLASAPRREEVWMKEKSEYDDWYNKITSTGRPRPSTPRPPAPPSSLPKVKERNPNLNRRFEGYHNNDSRSSTSERDAISDSRASNPFVADSTQSRRWSESLRVRRRREEDPNRGKREVSERKRKHVSGKKHKNKRRKKVTTEQHETNKERRRGKESERTST